MLINSRAIQQFINHHTTRREWSLRKANQMYCVVYKDRRFYYLLFYPPQSWKAGVPKTKINYVSEIEKGSDKK